jgi:hypothetical protein
MRADGSGQRHPRGKAMALRIHVTKIEAAEEGGALVSIVIESDLGPIELEIYADLKTDARNSDPIVNAIDEVREKLQIFGDELRNEMAKPGILNKMLRLSRPTYEQSDEVDDE